MGHNCRSGTQGPFSTPACTFSLPYILTVGVSHRENLLCHRHVIRSSDTDGPPTAT
ncbi:hypothetical protein PAXRUDRAFT_22402 [Paxillus rubicundulus Ve08.2h10]|uniref:Uncharacterized protein n=1 Tax=Paxillus rubicundulus Ve08.2h10 TaxID=930991 RepID=A0A0D0D5G6_9AGAM|nr:hypothetical protein PAXRUDRAFT_22402 [Paxillus rubicundulus Ve08.2h10]